MLSNLLWQFRLNLALVKSSFTAILPTDSILKCPLVECGRTRWVLRGFARPPSQNAANKTRIIMFSNELKIKFFEKGGRALFNIYKRAADAENDMVLQ